MISRLAIIGLLLLVGCSDKPAFVYGDCFYNSCIDFSCEINGSRMVGVTGEKKYEHILPNDKFHKLCP